MNVIGSPAILSVTQRNGRLVNEIMNMRKISYRSGDLSSIKWRSIRSDVDSVHLFRRTKRNVIAKSEDVGDGSSNNVTWSEQPEILKIRRFLNNSRNISTQLVKGVTENVGALLLVFVLTESTSFLVNRVFHRLTNECKYLFHVT